MRGRFGTKIPLKLPKVGTQSQIYLKWGIRSLFLLQVNLINSSWTWFPLKSWDGNRCPALRRGHRTLVHTVARALSSGLAVPNPLESF